MAGEWITQQGFMNGCVYDIIDGKWILNDEATRDSQKRRAAAEKHEKDLCFALRSRPLTDEEMGEVARLDYYILVKEMVPYNETEVRRQFSDMLLQQFKLRAAAKEKV